MGNCKHFDFIDALRGYAILGVIVVHVASALPPTNGLGMKLFEQGARGVQLFYVISAFTLLLSWHARRDGFILFGIRRFFRISPLFWLAIPVYLCFAGLRTGYYAPQSNWTINDILAEAFFLNGLIPAGASLVPGGWTVDTEMLFYLIFPALVFFIRNWYVAISCYVLCLMAGQGFWAWYINFLFQSAPDKSQGAVAAWGELSLPMQLPIFLSGFVAYYLSLEDWSFSKSSAFQSAVALVAMMTFVIFTYYPPPVVGFFGIPLGLLVYSLSKGGCKVLVNYAAINLGKISFSAYIWHFMVINFFYLAMDYGFNIFGIGIRDSSLNFVAFILAVLFFTVCISLASYKFIENPMIRLGSIITKKSC